MGMPGKRRRRRSKAAGGEAAEPEPEPHRPKGVFDETEDLDDEVDAFHRDRIPLDSDDDDDNDEGGGRGAGRVGGKGRADPRFGAVESVLEIDDDDDDDDDDDSDDDDDDDDDDAEEDEEDEDGGRAGEGSDSDALNSIGGSDDEDPEAAEERLTKQWGKKRQSYYDTDYVDPDFRIEDEELQMAEEEEKEALRLQRGQLEDLDEEDYDLPELLAAAKRRAAKEGARGKPSDARSRTEVMNEFDAALDELAPAGGASRERIEKDLSRLSADERLAMLVERAPEALDLCEEVVSRSAELESVVKPALVAHATGARRLSESGLAYLQLRHRLLLVYLLSLGYYLYLRSLRTPTAQVAAHPCIRQIVALRKQLADLEPVHDEVGPQLELFAAGAAAESGSGSAESEGDGEEDSGDGSDSEDGDDGERRGQRAANGRKRTAECSDDDDDDDDDDDSDQEEEEEDGAAAAKASASVSACASVRAGKCSAAAAAAAPSRLQRMSIEDAKAQQAALVKSAKRKARMRRRVAAEVGDAAVGDDELADEKVRRRQAEETARRLQQALADAGSRGFGSDDDDDGDNANGWGEGDDDGEGSGDGDDAAAAAFYKAVEAASKAKRSAKASAGEGEAAAEWAESTEDNRAITWAMKKNKGLTPSRRKEMRNPRVRHRNKFTKATKRRKGQVVEMRSQKERYTGEAVGIRTDIAKSTRLK